MNFKPLSILIVLAVGTGLTYLFWDVLWLGGGWIGGDMYSYYLPQKFTYQQALERGDWALWNDLVSLGYPQLAESQTGVFYPFHLLFYSTLSLNEAYHINQLVHYVIAFAGMAVLAQAFGLSLRASLLAGLVYVYGWFPERNCLEWAIIGGAWLPWAVWCLERFLTTRWWRYLIGLLVAIALQLLPGHFVIAFLTLLLVIAYAVARIWWVPAFGEAAEKSPPSTGRFPLLLAAGGALFLAFSLSAIQLLPTWQLKQNSQREQGAHDIGYGHLPPAYLSQVILPWTWYWQPAPARDSQIQQLEFLAIGSSTNQVEAHLYFGLIPLLLALAGLIPSRNQRPFAGRQRTLLWGLALLALTYAFGWWLPITRHLPGFSFFIGPGRYTLITTLCVSLLAAESADRWLSNLFPGTRTLAWAVILVLTVYDLFTVSRLVFYAEPTMAPPITYRDQSTISRFLKDVEADRDEPVRLYATGENLPTLLGFSSVKEYLGMGPAEYYDPELKIPPLPKLEEGSTVIPLDEAFVSWLQRAGVTHLLLEYPLAREWPAELVLKEADPFLNACWGRPFYTIFYVYELQDTRGRWFWAEDAENASVSLAASVPARKEYRVDLDQPNRFVVTELLLPGWNVTIDGKRAEPVKVEGLFRGVDVPAGEHVIVWSYHPLSFRLGAWISVITLVILAIIAHIRYWHPQRLRWLNESEGKPRSGGSE